MKPFDWSAEKNEKLRIERGVTFNDIIIAVQENRVLATIPHYQKKCANQQIYIIEINQYAYLVTFVEQKDKIFLKTIIPSRKATRDYIIKPKKEEK